MGVNSGNISRYGSVETTELEAGLQAILMQLDASDQPLAAAYVALAINVLLPDPLDFSQFVQFHTRARPRS